MNGVPLQVTLALDGREPATGLSIVKQEAAADIRGFLAVLRLKKREGQSAPLVSLPYQP